VQHDETLEDVRVRKVFFRRQLCTLRRPDPDGRLVGDEAGDAARFTSLADDVDSLKRKEKGESKEIRKG
jgi:hypothetical protein